jgi:alpha-galactosidase
MAKPLADGSLAVGLFNLWELPREMTVTWEQLGIQGKHRVRDVWRQQDVADADREYSAKIGRHGVSLVRLWPAQH